MDSKDLIENYQHQLAELERQYFFENMDMKEYCVRYDAINKRISELENEARGNTIWQKIKVFARQQKKKISKIIAGRRASWGGSQDIHN
tara:strand:+ start:780 stop:1046 length:267 start_codon:yes stop_codon:yes gene_type:complete